jgi:hypothetical protein
MCAAPHAIENTSLPSIIPGIFFGDLYLSRSNFVGTEFVVFDNGVNPKDAGSAAASAVSSTSVRQELASVIYVCVSRILHSCMVVSVALHSSG